jgi:hypothetical protein
MAEERVKRADFSGSGPVDPGDMGHRMKRLERLIEDERAEWRRRHLIMERRILALEGRGLPLKLGEASRNLPTLEELAAEFEGSMDLRGRVERLEIMTGVTFGVTAERNVTARNVTEGGAVTGSVTGSVTGAVTGRARTNAERQRDYRERRKEENDGGEAEEPGGAGDADYDQDT